jgi:hypothetical protein
LINQIQQAAAKIAPQDQAEQLRVLVGSFIEIALHETAHAIYDIFQVPIWGREEDGADRLAALIMVEFGEDMERTAIIGTVELFEYSAKTGKTWTGSDFADTGSPDAQRYYNYLCIGAAADPLNFGGWMDAEWVDKSKSIIPKDRADDCNHEYEQIRKAFNLRIMPYVDRPDRREGDAMAQLDARPMTQLERTTRPCPHVSIAPCDRPPQPPYRRCSPRSRSSRPWRHRLPQVAAEVSNPKIVLLERPNDAGKGDASQTDPEKRKPQPLSPDRAKVRDDMKKRRVLEEYAEFLSPLRLPRTLRVIASDCASHSWDSPYYSSDDAG